MGEDRKIIAENRQARFNYFIEEKIECGIALEGTEVKSVKNGRVKTTLGLCKGKKLFDKREAIKERDVDRQIQRAFRRELE